MALVVKNRVKVTATTTGTGTFTLGSAVTGYQSFANIGNANQTYYLITLNNDWEVGIGTYTSSGTTLSRDRVFGSSNSGALVDWPAGTKTVSVVYPTEATAGGVPYFDDSEVGTDLSGWEPFQSALQAGIVGGQTYNNNGTNGIISTYSSLASAVGGAILNQNGNIVAIPAQSTTQGQILNPYTGVVSTYSLVYTATSATYYGGVLAPNGDIHFVPRSSPVGQRISASGVVSTYSLVYTTTNAYRGGVLAPNGDVHFIPSSAAVGQKISSSGVVSTYSLVYTAATAYQGGVLAPNGDIYFVPYAANRGQKISAAGVVSTYSLVYTSGSSYSGGVIAPNGDIYFVPWSAQVGQKISAAGVVSTYSLVYTTGSAYAGGVLAPNGDIHFVPSGATVGQKINFSGVVSTYSLVITTDFPEGGVLTFNGDIYFIGSSITSQKISTNPGQLLGPGVCLSPFLNKF